MSRALSTRRIRCPGPGFTICRGGSKEASPIKIEREVKEGYILHISESTGCSCMQSKPSIIKKTAKVIINKSDGSQIEEPTFVLGPCEVLKGHTDGIRDFAKINYPPVGFCIYCSATENLRREHIVPYGLNGTAVLNDASCPKCAKITGAFEAQVLRGPLRSLRVLRELRSRSNHRDAPRKERLQIIRNGLPEIIELPINEFPILLNFPAFCPPRFFTGENGHGIDLKGIFTISFGPPPEEVGARLGAEKITIDCGKDRFVAFARMIAKIGYAMAVAEGKLGRIDGPCPVLPSILGEVDDIGRWVGILPKPIRKYPGLLHRIDIHEDQKQGILVAEVQLFADSETPSYGVILGQLN